MRISVITVCFNSKETLEQTIKSVVGQEYEDKEYIVIDGGSTDGTVDILKKYAEQIAFWLSEPDEGIYDAMNKGIKHATGDVIAFLNSDDWYEPDTLTRVAGYFLSNRIDCLGGEVNSVIRGRKLKRKRSHTKEDIHFYMIYNHPAFFVRRKVFDEIGMFQTQYKIAADYDFVLRVHNAGYVIMEVEDVFTNFRREGLSEIQRYRAVSEGKEISLNHLGEHGDTLKEQILGRINPDEEYDRTILQMVLRNDLPFVSSILNNGKNVYVWGTGTTGYYFLELLLKADIEVMGFLDSYHTQNDFQGYPVFKLQDLSKDAFVCIATMNYCNDIIATLKEIGVDENHYLTFLEFRNQIIEYGKQIYTGEVL
ncbi:putative glycosyltransferase [Lachnospiraceae bacterium]|nr:putative glycosyltransferase [Lachnospiraceae bacterium]